jgi:predicted Zn-dependent protease
MSRKERIEAMLVDDPQDSFLRYGLAMELIKEDATDRALDLFQGLMNDSPPYIPAFLMAAQQRVQLEQIDQARRVLREGIEAARLQNESHAAGEMADLLANLGSYGEPGS